MKDIKDLDLERLNESLEAIEQAITHQTQAILMVGILAFITLIIVAIGVYAATRPEPDEDRTSNFDFDVFRRLRRMGKGAA